MNLGIELASVLHSATTELAPSTIEIAVQDERREETFEANLICLDGPSAERIFLQAGQIA